jgi:hypothetical protein
MTASLAEEATVSSAWRYGVLFAVMAALHQDVWLWTDGRRLFGVLPIGLAYHVAYTVLAAVVLALLVRRDWPAAVDDVESEKARGA